MGRTVTLNRLDGVLADLDYPIGRGTAAEACGEVTLQLADRTAALDEVIAGSDAESFEAVDELQSEVMSLLPREAVGEPYQSEGEG